MKIFREGAIVAIISHLILISLTAACSQKPPRMVITKENGDRISGPLVENLSVISTLQSDPLEFSENQIDEITLESSSTAEVTIKTTDGNTIRGRVNGDRIGVIVEGQEIWIPIQAIDELSIER